MQNSPLAPLKSVKKLDDYTSLDTITALKELLLQAESGEIGGIMFCIKNKRTGHALGLTGIYARDPSRAIGAAERLKHRLNVMIDADESQESAFVAL